MEQIKIIFFVLASFFNTEDGRIVADKTTVTVHPENKELVIVQENLFAIIRTEEDTPSVLKEWDQLSQWKENKLSWAAELDSFATKNFTVIKSSDAIQPQLTLAYTNEKQLRELGIWYDAEKNQFSINHNPNYNIKTETGTLDGNYWVFNGESPFSFSVAPFLDIPEQYLQFKKPLLELVNEGKN